jgi:hypothetical protein
MWRKRRNKDMEGGSRRDAPHALWAKQNRLHGFMKRQENRVVGAPIIRDKRYCNKRWEGKGS